MAEKKKGKRGTQSGEVENIDTRIKGMTDRLTSQKKNKGDSIPELDKLYEIKNRKQREQEKELGLKAGGKVKAKKKAVKKFKGDGIARKGKTKGRFV